MWFWTNPSKIVFIRTFENFQAKNSVLKKKILKFLKTEKMFFAILRSLFLTLHSKYISFIWRNCSLSDIKVYFRKKVIKKNVNDTLCLQNYQKCVFSSAKIQKQKNFIISKKMSYLSCFCIKNHNGNVAYT